MRTSPRTSSPPIGSRWLTWGILAYGVLEIPWVVYLLFFQVRTGTAEHTHLASLGLTGGAVVVALAAAWAIARRSRWRAPLSVMAATWLAAGTFFAVVVSTVHLVWAACLGVVLAVVAAWRAFVRPWSSMDAVLAAALSFVAAFLVLNLAHTVQDAPTSLAADHLRLLIVLYDSAEVAALLSLGLSLRAGAARASITFGSIGSVLFLLDAYLNLVVVPSGQAFVAAVFYAVVGELPSIVMCLAGVIIAMKRWVEHDVAGLPRSPQQA